MNQCTNPDVCCRLRPGDVVQVRSEAEIRATLDADGKHDGLLFMEEMRRFCGRTFRVYRRGDKTCAEGNGLRRMPNAVTLDGVACDGSAHGGCKRTCQIYWKEAWLSRCSSDAGVERPTHADAAPAAVELPNGTICTCQSTEMHRATTPLPLWDLRQYVCDLQHLTWTQFTRIVCILLANTTRRLLGLPDLRQLCGNSTAPSMPPLNLQPGELVELKSRNEIAETLNKHGKLGGLESMPEMIQHCGKQFRVLKRLDKMVFEGTGELRSLKNTVLLEGLVCDGSSHRGCPRASYVYVREAWLRRVEP
jgi:hypothetical protein